MLILRAKIALNAAICMILFIFSLIMELWLLRNIGFYCSFLQFYAINFEPTILLNIIACSDHLTTVKRDENVLQSHINNYHLFLHFHFKFIWAGDAKTCMFWSALYHSVAFTKLQATCKHNMSLP